MTRFVTVLAMACGLLLGHVAGAEENPAVVRPANWFESGGQDEHELTAGDTHRYDFRLEEGWYLEADVEQLGIDVVLFVFGPDGEELASFDSPTQNRGTESAFLVSQAAGTYHLEVRAFYQEREEGRYRIRRRELRPATTKDRHRYRCLEIYLEGWHLRARSFTVRDHRQVMRLFEEALVHTRLAGDRVREAWLLTWLSGEHRKLGEVIDTLALARQALALWREVGHRGQEISETLNIALTYTTLGEPQKGLDYLSSALEMSKEIEDQNPRWKGETLRTLGHVHASLGELIIAIPFFEKALSIWRSEEIPYRQVRALMELGQLRASLKQYDLAWGHFEEALTLSRNGHESLQQAVILFEMAKSKAILGHRQEAAAYKRRAIASWNDTEESRSKTPLHLLRHLAELDERLGNLQPALEKYRGSLAYAREAEAPGAAAEILYRIASLEAGLGHLEEALDAAGEATELIETQRGVINGERFRALFLATRLDYYELRIDLLMRLHLQHPLAGHDLRAFEVLERSRARSLLELLSASPGRLRRGVDPRLLARERELEGRFEGIVLKEVSSSEGAEPIPDIKLADLTSELEEVRSRIRGENLNDPERASPQPVRLTRIQEQVLDEDTLLLEYVLAEQRGFLWAVTKDSVESFELPGRVEVENLARRAYDLLTSRGRHYQGDTAQTYRRRNQQADDEYSAAAAELSDMLLAPAWSSVRHRRILVVGDGILQHLPFSALPVPGTPDTPLVERHEVVTAPSAATLDALRRRPAGPSPERTLAVVADPALGNGRQEERRWGLLRHAETVPLVRSMRDLGLARLAPLPGTRAEANALLELLPSAESFAALGHDASRETVLGGGLRGHRIIHFASHAFLNNRHPDLSGIVLSLYDEEGRAQDGFLRLHDVYELDLPADLVVLSACQTALGQQIRGEGLVGLTRAFLHAGASAVVASLWSNDDLATAELMKRFYRFMLRDGLAPSAALRRARQELRREEEWQAPYFWAAFVLQGDWRPPNRRP